MLAALELHRNLITDLRRLANPTGAVCTAVAA